MPEDYVSKQTERVVKFRSALDLETDRGCALLAISFLEEELKILLKKCLVEIPKVEEIVFSFNGPLGTFSSKIEMAFFLGKISKTIKNELNLLRKIRNHFGHSPELIDFNSHPINDRCKSLKGSWKNKNSTPRQHFTASVCSILAILHAEIYSTKHPAEREFDFPFSAMKEEYENKIVEIVKLIKGKINTKG